MINYRIHPLVAGKIGAVNCDAGPMADRTTAGVCPILAFYLEGGSKKILVDTGLVNGVPAENFHGFSLIDAGPRNLIKALAEIDLKPEDIDIVILTRLRHAANIRLFPKARFVVPKGEWDFAQSLLMDQAGMYLNELINELAHYDLVLTKEEYQVTDGVKVRSVPGHNEEQQVVVVNTSDGIYVLTGNLTYTMLNIDSNTTEITDMLGSKISYTPKPDHAFYQPLMHTDLTDWYNIITRISSLVGTCNCIITGYDPNLVGKIFPEK